MSKLANVWVFSDNVERYAELMAGARLWGEQVHLIVLGNEQASQVKPLGADEIVVLEATSGLQRVENFAETIAALIQEHTGLLLMPATKRAKSLGARLSIQLNAAMVNRRRDHTSRFFILLRGMRCSMRNMWHSSPGILSIQTVTRMWRPRLCALGRSPFEPRY